MRRVRKAYADLEGGQLHYHAIDGIDPPILFLHQIASSARSYEPLLRALTLPNRLIAIDTPGFGGSFELAGAVSLGDYARVTIEAADALSIERFHLFGHHSGASMAIEIAAGWPDRVASLMLSGPVFLTPEQQARLIAQYETPIIPVSDGSHLLDYWEFSRVNNPNCSAELLQSAMADLLRAWRARPQAYQAVARHDTAARAALLSQPTLLLTSPGAYANATFDRARALFPDAPVAVTGGDNVPPSADALGVAQAIEAFIRGLPKSAR